MESMIETRNIIQSFPVAGGKELGTQEYQYSDSGR